MHMYNIHVYMKVSIYFLKSPGRKHVKLLTAIIVHGLSEVVGGMEAVFYFCSTDDQTICHENSVSGPQFPHLKE